MRFWQWVRAAKIVALIAFFLPWVTVSCANTRLASASGWQLVTGHVSVTDPVTRATRHGGDLNIVLLIALLCIVVGLILSFRSARKGALPVTATSLAALALIGFAARDWSKASLVRQAAQAQGTATGTVADVRRQLGTEVLGALRIDWQLGLWLTLGGLAAAAVLAFLSRLDERRAIGS
jgi:hypothetical protein